MLDCWLKIRDRGDIHFLLKHLDMWLGLFSDPAKYNVYLYNENVNLPPEYYATYNVISKAQVLQNNDCKNLFALVNSSLISIPWRGAAFALATPYYYLPNSRHILNIDADDIMLLGDGGKYIDRALQTINDLSLPTLSYDYIYSFNPFDGGRNLMPNHWSFGCNVSNTGQMRGLIDRVLHNIRIYTNYIPNINMAYEVNLDILMSAYFRHEGGNCRYVGFATKEGFIHDGFWNRAKYWTRFRDGMIHLDFDGRHSKHQLNHRSIYFD